MANWTNEELKLTSVSNCQLRRGEDVVDFDWLYDGRVMITSSATFIDSPLIGDNRHGFARRLWNDCIDAGFTHVNPRKRKSMKEAEEEERQYQLEVTVRVVW